MTRKLLVIGAGGRLGKAVARVAAASGWQVIGLDRTALDLASAHAIERQLNGIDFDAAINTAALTNVDYCERHPAEAQTVNATAPQLIALLCARRNARFAHVSTDYVFAGNEPGLRFEDDPTEPLSHYGVSKLAGERAVLNADASHLVVRVSWVFGPERPSFIDFILSEARTKDRAKAIGDKWSLPGYAADLADGILALLEPNIPGGIVHLCNSGSPCSWQEYGQFAVDCAAKHGIALKTSTVEFQSLASMEQFIARRPIHTALATSKFTRLTGRTPRSWHDAVDDFVRTHIAPP